jgi:hypothetical protein
MAYGSDMGVKSVSLLEAVAEHRTKTDPSNRLPQWPDTAARDETGAEHTPFDRVVTSEPIDALLRTNTFICIVYLVCQRKNISRRTKHASSFSRAVTMPMGMTMLSIVVHRRSSRRDNPSERLSLASSSAMRMIVA